MAEVIDASEYERGVAAGKIEGQLAAHSQRLSVINGSVAETAVQLRELTAQIAELAGTVRGMTHEVAQLRQYVPIVEDLQRGHRRSLRGWQLTAAGSAVVVPTLLAVAFHLFGLY